MRAVAVASPLLLLGYATAQTFSDETIARVKANLASSAQQSWELGTRAQTLLELDAPPFSVFSDDSIPPPFGSEDANTVSEVINIAAQVVRQLPEGDAPRPLDDGAGGDPPSLGIAVLLAHAANPQNASRYQQAADNQLAYLLTALPRSNGGAISHRIEQVQLWSDFVYMTPPFLAYYGAYTGNKTILDLAYDQCKAYESELYDGGKKLWRHMALAPSNDDGFWSTGNGWAAMGMLRVLATMKHSRWEGDYGGKMKDLENWVSHILDGMYSKLDRGSNLHHNYVDEKNSFLDAAGTALIAASTYRLSLLRGVHKHIPDAERVRKALVARVDDNGWLSPVVNPVNFADQGSRSPEAQAFVLQLHAAYNEWVDEGSKGKDAALATRPNALVAVVVAIAAYVLVL